MGEFLCFAAHAPPQCAREWNGSHMIRPARLVPECATRILAGAALLSMLVGGLVPSLALPVEAAKAKARPKKNVEPPRPPLKPREAAADARVAVSSLLGEYVVLAWSATTAAVENRQKEQRAAFSALEGNAGQLGHAVGRLFGDKNGDAFGQQWKRQLAPLMDYAVAVRRKDAAKQEAATKALDASASALASVLTGMSGGKRSVEALTKAHRSFLNLLRQMIDARAAGDYNTEFTDQAKAYRDLWEAGREMSMAAAALAPTKLGGNPDSPAAAFRANLACLIAENTYMQSVGAMAALSGRTDEFYAITVRLDLNSEELQKLLTDVLGEDNCGKFMSAWKKQQNYLSDYTHARDLRDGTNRSKLFKDLRKSAIEMGDMLVTVSRRRLTARVTHGLCNDLTSDQIGTIDAWSSKNWGGGFGGLQRSWKHATMMANLLSDAVVEEYADKLAPGGSGGSGPEKKEGEEKKEPSADK